MKEAPKVSIIVPVYKAEKYLHRCVDSILAQTFTDFELLLVDDGSPDSSGTICDHYATADPRVHVFHKPNGGVSSARQCGLDNAQGEYTIHADPDDWVEPDMLQELYTEAQRTNADMVICDFLQECANGKTQYIKQQPKALNSETVLQQLLFQQLHGSCWNKLVKRACYNNGNVKFPQNVILWEDLWVNCELLLNDISVAYLSKAFYHYDFHINANSIVRKPSVAGVESQFNFCDHFDEKLKNRAFSWKDDALFIIKSAIKGLMYCSRLYSESEVIEKYKEINSRYITENINIKRVKQIFDTHYHTALFLSGHTILSKLLMTITKVLINLKSIIYA